MQQAKPAMFFQVVRQFDIKGGGTGVILKNVRSPDDAVEHYVANINDLPSADVDSYIEIPCRKKGNDIVVPNELIRVWIGETLKDSRAIQLIYMSYLYNDPLHASRQQGVAVTSERVKKSFESKDVFAHPILLMLESVHDLLHVLKLHDVLLETNYQYNRSSVYTRFRDDPEDRSYSTPRSLNYYPMENLVKVTFTLGGVPDNIVVQVKKDKSQQVKVMPAMVNIIRTFRNEGWTSLRDIAHNDPQLKAFIMMFYNNGYGKPEPLNS